MTTIAWDGTSLAADSRLTSCNNAPAGQVTKAWRVGRSLYAHAGAAHDLERLVEWTHGTGQPNPHKLEEGVLVHITPTGDVRQWWTDGWIATRGKLFAWGSGERIALGALHAGASSERAVEIAVMLDTDTGDEITVLRLVELGRTR